MGSDRTYSLEIAIQPPAVASAGVPLYPPLVVRVHIHDAAGNEITGEDELSGLFAQAALYRESGSPPSIAPPDMFLLSGRLSMSLDLLDEPGAGSSTQGSYAIFPDLTINRSGRYTLGVSLFKVEGGRVRPSSAGISNGGAGGGTALEEAKTHVVFVQDGAVSTQIGKLSILSQRNPTLSLLDHSAQTWLDHLRGQGAAVPSPPRR